MKTSCALRLQIYNPNPAPAPWRTNNTTKSPQLPLHVPNLRGSPRQILVRCRKSRCVTVMIEKPVILENSPDQDCPKTETCPTGGAVRFIMVGAVSIGLGLVVMMGAEKAVALGPEGPMVEEFWDNVRRYALYALTVSTGAIYTILQPILELLKNPISAILILVIIGGSIFIVSQILSAMVGVSDFNYTYAY